MSSFWQDVRFAARALAGHRTVTTIAIACLALGIGINATIFSVTNGILLRPFPYRDPAALVALRQTFPERNVYDNEVTWADFVEWERSAKHAVAMGAWFNRGFTIGSATDLTQIDGAALSTGLTQTLGVQPLRGRPFVTADGAPGAPAVAMLSERVWRERYAADPAIVGSSIALNGRPHTVVGIMPAAFEFPDRARVWTPISLDPESQRGEHYMEAVARLRSGSTVAELQAELEAIAKRLAESHPETNRGWGASVTTLRDHEVGEQRPVLFVLQGSVLLVLLIACANVANLLLARGVARERELALRASLGAGRGRIIRLLLVEALLVALAGGAIGVALSMWGTDALRAMMPPVLPFWMHFGLDGRVLVFALLTSVAAAVVAGVYPALRSSRVDVQTALKSESRSGSASREARRSRHVLVVAEMAFAVMLMVAATLMMRSFVNMTQTKPGFATSQRLTAFVSLRDPRYDSTDTRAQALDRIVDAARAMPGVTAAAAVSNVPLNGNSSSSGVFTDDEPVIAGKQRPAEYRVVTPGYFETLEIPLIRGRTFTGSDATDGVKRVVVGQTLAERFFPGKDAVGRSLRLWDTTYQVIGIVGDSRLRAVHRPAAPQFYALFAEAPSRVMQLVVHSSGDPSAAFGALRAAVSRAVPGVPVYREATLDAVVDESMWAERAMGRLFSIFGLMALLLTAFGVYGVIAYTVSQRTREIGVRLALGAQRSDILRLVVRGALVLGVIGAGLGLGGAAAAGGALRFLLFGVSPTNPWVLGGVSLLLLAVAVLAAWLPARRAARLDPSLALRSE
jgi:predicted permease